MSWFHKGESDESKTPKNSEDSYQNEKDAALQTKREADIAYWRSLSIEALKEMITDQVRFIRPGQDSEDKVWKVAALRSVLSEKLYAAGLSDWDGQS